MQFRTRHILPKSDYTLHLYTCFWAMLYFYVNPLWRVRVEHRERLPWTGRAILVAHEANRVGSCA